jgi:hypothetical protein
MRGHVRQRGRDWAIVIDTRDPIVELQVLTDECRINSNSLKRSHP